MSAINAKPNEMFGPPDKNRQWQRELLMERLRTQSAQNKTFVELAKATRMAMLEKRYSLDAAERGSLQRCLDSMQHCIKVTTRQGLIERLESLSRQLGLKFMEDTSILFISSDMFYLEIVLDAAGTLSDVKVHHECKINQPQSCSDLVTCLLNGDFADFTAQLEGLSSIYRLEAEPKVKSRAFVALEAMETDLYGLYAAQDFHKDTHMILLESSVGIVQKRRGGHAMKLTYFIPPYDLLSLETKALTSLNIDLLSTQSLGLSATVNLEASSPNQLQILPTVTLNSDAQGASVASFAPITPTNSIMLPATFVLRLNKPLPVGERLLEAIAAATQQKCGDPNAISSILELVVQTASNGELQSGNKGLFVTLPDQNHCYFFTDNKQLKGSVIKSIPYTEPSHVPKILSLLRQQALFHTLLASCVRPESKMGDLENTTMLEVSAINIHQISVALEHPFEESMATIEFDLKDALNIDCRIFSITNNYDAVAIKLTKTIQKTLSIPITIRALLKFWDQEQQMKGFHRGGNGIDNGNFSLPVGPNDPGGRMNDFRDVKPKTERNMNGSFGGGGGGNRQFFHASAIMMGGGTTEPFSDASMSMFARSHDTAAMNQYAMKTTSDGSFLDTRDNIGGSDFYKCPKSKTDTTMNQTSSETSDSSSLGTSTPTSDFGVASNLNLRKETNVDSDSSLSFIDGDSSRNSMVNDTVVETMRRVSPKMERTLPDDWRLRNSLIDTKVSSILAVKTPRLEFNAVLSGMGLARRPGIEIIPITAATTQNLQTSITITPITSTSKLAKKSGSSRKNEDKSRNEKKRKRRKENSPSMGPPGKMLSKQDGLMRSAGVGVKTTDASELLKKLSGSGSKSFSGSLGRPSSKLSPSSHISPKHMSSSVTHSPKGGHYNTSSPKHASSGGTGKPSMSALKSATNSSPKSEKLGSKSSAREKDKDRERERSSKSSSLVSSISGGGSNSPKLKNSAVKLKQIDLSAALLPTTDHFTFDEATESDVSPVPGAGAVVGSSFGKFGMSAASSCSLAANKVRKGSLSAVIDKLKSAQHTSDDATLNVAHSSGEAASNREKISAGAGTKTAFNSTVNNALKLPASSLNTLSPALPLQSNQNSEYMIKPSLDGMKITINKTRSKDLPLSNHSVSNSYKSGSSTSSTSGGSFSKLFSSSGVASGGGGGLGSPKRHTGLKPGVNSGPASKKSHSSLSFAKTSSSSPQSYSHVQGRGNFQKSSSSGNLSSSLPSKSSAFPYISSKSLSSSSLSNSNDASKKDKAKNRTDASDVMKMLGFASPMDGFMKSLNTKFQIPKLSARTNDEPRKPELGKMIVPNALVVTTAATSPTAIPHCSPNYTSPSTPHSVTLPAKIVSANALPATAANESSKSVSEISSKDIPEKYAFSLMKVQNKVTIAPPPIIPANLGSNKVPCVFTNNENSLANNVQTGEAESVPSHSSPALNSLAPKEMFRANCLPPTTITTPTTAISHVMSPPYVPPIGVVGKAAPYQSCPAPLTEAISPAVAACFAENRQSDKVVMRPPSAPCSAAVMDMSKTTPNEAEATNKAECNANNLNNPSQPSSLLSDNGSASLELQNIINSTATRKLNPNSLVPQQHKISFPASPSVSVHIVKSPAPSPLMILPSPHSNSPCITDDELMDEALVGISGK